MRGPEILIPIIAIIAFFSAVITFIYMHYKSRHQQRMALIESGKTADIFFERKLDQKSNALKLGMLLTGAGLGFFAAIMLEEYTRMDEVLFLPLSAIGGGLGLILFYTTVKKNDNDYENLP